MKNRKTPPHSVGSDSAHGPGTAGLAYGHFGLVGPTDGATYARAIVIHGLAAHDRDTSRR
jgi:hypothetical protein